MPYSNGPRKKSGKIGTMSAFIAESSSQFSVLRKAGVWISSLSTFLLSLRLRLLPFLFCGKWSVHFKQALGQLHAHPLLLYIHAVEIRLGEGHFQQPRCSVTHH